MHEIKSVVFLKQDGGYRVGEMAGFPEPMAKRLIEAKHARPTKQADLDALEAKARKLPLPLVSVRFLRTEHPYHKGEFAGFAEDLALAYVDAGAAVLEDAPPEPPPAKAPDAAPATRAPDGPVEDKAIMSPQAKKALGR